MRVDVLGVSFDNVTMDEAVDKAMAFLEEDRPHLAATPNPEIVETCREDREALEAVQAAETDELVGKLFDGSADKLFASLLGRKKLSAEQIVRLKEIVGELE